VCNAGTVWDGQVCAPTSLTGNCGNLGYACNSLASCSNGACVCNPGTAWDGTKCATSTTGQSVGQYISTVHSLKMLVATVTRIGASLPSQQQRCTARVAQLSLPRFEHTLLTPRALRCTATAAAAAAVPLSCCCSGAQLYKRQRLRQEQLRPRRRGCAELLP
jgi:hypothetical protein